MSTMKLVEALQDLMYAASVRPSCQAGAITKCCCFKCADERARAALAEAEAQPVQEPRIGSLDEFFALAEANGIKTIHDLPGLIPALQATEAQPVQEPTPNAPPSYKLIAVNGFDELIQALERADRKGYLPDAMADEWAAFDWQAPVAAPPQPVPLSDEQWHLAFARAIERAHGIGKKTP